MWKDWHLLASVLGARRALYHLYQRWFGGLKNLVYRVHPKGILYPTYARADSSDIAVCYYVLIENEYAPLYGLKDVRLVIDCGANVGYSSTCFLSRFPNCCVMAVEPDPDNFKMLERNLRAYGERAKLVRAGVWSHTTGLAIREIPYRGGQAWTRQVRPCEPNEKADLEGASIESLRVSSGHDRISLLKVDIEGAEVVLFRDNLEWLDKVDAMAIELHDDTHFGRASEIFFHAIQGRGFDVSQNGFLTFCVRPGLKMGT